PDKVLYDRAMDAMKHGKYTVARTLLETLINTYPDSEFIARAKLSVGDSWYAEGGTAALQQAEAEYKDFITFFPNLPEAAEAQLKSLIDSYPLYSEVDEALFTLGGIYERQANALRQQKNIPAAAKEKLVAEYEQNAIDAYSKIVTRYPAMERTEDAKKRLAAMKALVPAPTAEALAQNKAEENSREETGRFHSVMNNFRKKPDINKSAKVGEPSMEPEEVASAPALMKHLNDEIQGSTAAAQPTQKLGVEGVKVGTGAAPEGNQPPPGSQNQPADNTGAQTPPDRVNDIQTTSTTATTQSGSQASADGKQDQQNSTDQKDSSSKKKGKKGLRK